MISTKFLVPVLCSPPFSSLGDYLLRTLSDRQPVNLLNRDLEPFAFAFLLDLDDGRLVTLWWL